MKYEIGQRWVRFCGSSINKIDKVVEITILSPLTYKILIHKEFVGTTEIYGSNNIFIGEGEWWFILKGQEKKEA